MGGNLPCVSLGMRLASKNKNMKKNFVSNIASSRRVLTLVAATSVLLPLAACGDRDEEAQNTGVDETVTAVQSSGAKTPDSSPSSTTDDLGKYFDDKELFAETSKGAGVSEFDGFKVSINEVRPDGLFNTESTDPDKIAGRSLAVRVQEDAPPSGYNLSSPSMKGKNVADALRMSPVKYWLTCTESIEPVEISYGDYGASLTFSESDTKKVNEASKIGWRGGHLVLRDVENPCEKAKEIRDEIGENAPDDNQIIGLTVSSSGDATDAISLSEVRTPQP